MQIREWIDRVLKISIRDGVDLQNAVKLAEEICRLSAGPVHGGAVNFLSRARCGAAHMPPEITAQRLGISAETFREWNI